MLNVYVYGNNGADSPLVITECARLIEKLGHNLTNDLMASHLAVAPLLRGFLSLEAINNPRIGTLVFHPSLLPRHRGADAIKWAFQLGETYTGVTWFWPDQGIDTGDICEQEVLAITKGETPREFYERAVIPAAIRTLERALFYIDRGIIRSVPQIHENGTYESKIKK